MERVPDSTVEPLEFRKHIELLDRFTRTYQEHSGKDVAIREASCLEVQFPDMLGSIEKGDLLAGKVRMPAICFTPQAPGNEGGFAYSCNMEAIDRLLEHPEAGSADRSLLKELKEFWRDERTGARTRAAYPPELQEGLPSDNWTGEPGIAFPLYRMAGTHLDYNKLIDKGIPGLSALALNKMNQNGIDEQQKNFYLACMNVLNLLVKICHYYADQSEGLAASAGGQDRKDLIHLSEALRALTIHKPMHFFEGVQLAFLYCLVSGSHNYGRIDEYLGELLDRDLKSGYMDEKEGLRILCGLWKLMIARNAPYDGRVIIGGKGRRREKMADRVALLAIEATRQVKDILPQLTLRFYKGQNPELYKRALDAIGEGCTFPMLYNDDVNIPAAAKAFNISKKEARKVIPFGCGEYIVYHRSVGTPSSVLNLLKALEVTLHRGIDPLSGRHFGIDLPDSDFSSYQDLEKAYRKQLEYHIDLLALQEEIEYRVAGETAPFLYFSILYDDCLERGKGIFSGGVRYLGGTMELYGFTNVADSLTAIKKLVYEEEKISLDRLTLALKEDFKDAEDIRALLLKEPKYGNDDDRADHMAAWLHNFVCEYTRGRKEKTKLHSYLAVNINNDANTTLGRYTGASADGRKAFTSMSNGNAPMTGMDSNGITALLNSLVKLTAENHAGLVQNLKFSKELFGPHRSRLEALLKTYFMKGGTQAMITVVDRNELEKAMAEPEHYQNLIVRVGGFSARFVELSREVQLEILDRTLY